MSDQAPSEPHLERDTVAMLTPIPNGKVLAAICGINKIYAKVIETPAGAFAVLDDSSESACDDAAAAISMFVKDRPMLAMERRDGQISIRQWLGGAKGSPVSPGLALDKAPNSITRLMTGTRTIEQLAADHPEMVHAGHTTRWGAFWALRRLSAQAKREQRD